MLTIFLTLVDLCLLRHNSVIYFVGHRIGKSWKTAKQVGFLIISEPRKILPGKTIINRDDYCMLI